MVATIAISLYEFCISIFDVFLLFLLEKVQWKHLTIYLVYGLIAIHLKMTNFLRKLSYRENMAIYNSEISCSTTYER